METLLGSERQPDKKLLSTILTAQLMAGAAAKQVMKSMVPQWLRELQPKRKDIYVVLTLPHGGLHPVTFEYMTAGKRSTNWTGAEPPIHGIDIYYEGVGSRDIIFKAKHMLDLLGIPVIVIGHTWKDWSLTKKWTAVNNLDIDKKRAFGDEIHSNSTSKVIDVVTGFEVFTSPGDTPADPMATIRMEELAKEFPGMKPRTGYGTVKEETRDMDKEARFSMLVYTDIPFTITESVFHNEEQFCKNILMKEEGRYRIARACVKSYVRTINERF